MKIFNDVPSSAEVTSLSDPEEKFCSNFLQRNSRISEVSCDIFTKHRNNDFMCSEYKRHKMSYLQEHRLYILEKYIWKMEAIYSSDKNVTWVNINRTVEFETANSPVCQFSVTLTREKNKHSESEDQINKQKQTNSCNNKNYQLLPCDFRSPEMSESKFSWLSYNLIFNAVSDLFYIASNITERR